MREPEAIFFDAVGTLFGTRGSVGQIYSRLAREFDVVADPIALDAAFRTAFEQAPPLAFPGADPATIPERERAWWQAVARDTFTRAGVIAQFDDFDASFGRFYDFFTTPDAWIVYPDVRYTLSRWRDRGTPLGILSNFDSRIERVLESCGLRSFFSSVTIASTTGAAKPDPRIFAAAVAKCPGLDPARALHVGDSYTDDYLAARAAGLRAYWLQRSPLS